MDQKEKIGILQRVAPNTGGLVFKDEPNVWYNATKTAAQYVKADLKGKEVSIRLADKPHTFSFISIRSIPEKSPAEQGVKEETKNPMTKDNYWERKEARDLIRDEKISRFGALNTALEAIKASGSAGEGITADGILDLAEQLANMKVLPFIKNTIEDK